MKNKKIRISCYILALIGVAATAVVYPFLPDQIPTNWGFDGHISYSPRSHIWVCCGLLPLLAFLFDFLPSIDPRKANYIKFSLHYDSFCLFMQFFLLLMLGITISESLYPGHISVGKVVTVVIGILFMFVGNILPKIKSNYYMGIKNPWTLSDEEIWYKAHRLGGKTMFIAGAAMLIFGWPLTTKWGGILALTALLSALLIPSVMSYVWWRKKQNSI